MNFYNFVTKGAGNGGITAPSTWCIQSGLQNSPGEQQVTDAEKHIAIIL